MLQKSYVLRSLGDVEACVSYFREELEAAGKGPARHRMVLSIFTHWNTPTQIRAMVEGFRGAFPEAEIAGMTTSGAIQAGRVLLCQTVVSMQVFDHSEVRALIYDFSSRSMTDIGEDVLYRCRAAGHVSAVALMITQERFDLDPFYHALNQLPKEVPIFGGYADGNTPQEPVYVFDKQRILPRGILAVVYAGQLKALLHSVMGWQPLGHVMKVTATEGALILKELDHKPAAYFYEKYLHSVDFRPTSLPFPLVRTVEGRHLAMQPFDARKDGAILLNVSCRVGDEVQMAYGDPEQILLASREVLSSIQEFAPEGMLLFSCMTRRLFLKETGGQLLQGYYDICPAPGGYVSGEITRIGGRIYPTNMTLISVAFRESDAPLPHQFSALESPVVLNETLSTIQRLATFITEATKELQETQKQLSIAATHDSFTGLLNRGSIEALLLRQIEDMQLRQIPFSAIMVDLDEFKQVNDHYGHDKGDQVLRRVADVMKQHLRPTDAAGRWGGDEFVVILPGTSLDAAALVAKRLRSAIGTVDLLPDQIPVTASFGVTTSSPDETEQSFYKRMDDALYLAKGGGRNQVILLDTDNQVLAVK